LRLFGFAGLANLGSTNSLTGKATLHGYVGVISDKLTGMNKPSFLENSVGRWLLVVISLLLGIFSLYLNVYIIYLVHRGGMESAQWQFALPSLIVFGALAAGAGSLSIAHRPIRFPRRIVPALILANAALIGFLILKAWF
jgi:hypothetical protein